MSERVRMLNIRLTEDEAEMLRKKAELAGQSASDLVRDFIRRAPDGVEAKLTHDHRCLLLQFAGDVDRGKSVEEIRAGMSRRGCGVEKLSSLLRELRTFELLEKATNEYRLTASGRAFVLDTWKPTLKP
jgi:hypothetical protein